ncbi:hypothetical protein [Tichowtungia aerotolerans]|uniref:Uncharacterized protein n=1 Tax=Tichowtungia aerotolerans TaxID=2697043 RepID=A0A6P1M484_9BACT|nr:hypothetical protein [Tichowtungia aerotolerans]QHI69410.1 hypothetical protein GT409_08070 [Tichowtungia aerotolerans]
MRRMFWGFLVTLAMHAHLLAFSFTLQGGIAEQSSGTLYVGASRTYQSIHDALDYLSDKKITGDVTIAVDPGGYDYVEPICVNHQDAHRITIAGNSGGGADVITLGSGAILSVAAKDRDGNASVGPASDVDCYLVSISIPSADVGKVSAGDYVLIRALTGDLNDAYEVFQGSWEVAEVVADPPQMKIRHRYPMYPFPVNASNGLLNITGGQAIVLNTVLKFYACEGITAEGRKLGSIQNLALVGDCRPVIDPANLYVSNPGLSSEDYATVLENHASRALGNAWGAVFHGVQAELGGNVSIDRYVGISQFDGQGVSALGGSCVTADRTASCANERRGFYPTQTAYMRCDETIGSANNTDGYLADLNAVLEIESAAAAGNREQGVLALHKGRVYVKSSVSCGNGVGGFCARAGLSEMLMSTTGTAKNWAKNNLGPGVYAANGGEIRMAYTWVKNNAVNGVDGDLFSKWFLGSENNSYSNGGNSWDFASPDLVVSNSDYTAWSYHTMPFAAKTWSSDNRRKILLLDDNKGPYEAHYTINPLLPAGGVNFKNLYDFFEFIDDYRIQANGKMLNVELAYGVHHYYKTLVIDHPDASKIKIYGKRLISKEYVDIRILDTVDVTRYSNYCTAELQLVDSYEDRVDVGDYLNIISSDSSDGSDHELFRGAWEVIAKNDTTHTVTIKILQRDAGLASRLEASKISGISGGYVTAKLLKSVIKFYAADGIVVDNTLLGDLSGVCLIGDYTGLTNPPDYAANPPSVFSSQTILDRLASAYTNGWVEYDGIHVMDTGSINISGASAVCGFPGSGAYVSNGSVVENFMHRTQSLALMTACANRRSGVYCTQDSTFQSKASGSVHNRASGYVADSNSMLYVSIASAIANADYGFCVDGDSMLSGNRTKALFNLDSGYVTTDRSHSTAAESESRENGLHGYYLYDSTGAFEYSVADQNAQYGFALIESIGRMYSLTVSGQGCGLYGKDYDSLYLRKTWLYSPNSLIENNDIGVWADKNAVLTVTGSTLSGNQVGVSTTSGGVIIQ